MGTPEIGLKARSGSENSTELLKSVSLRMPWGWVLFFLSLYSYMLSHFIYFAQQCVSFVLPRMRLLQAPPFHSFVYNFGLRVNFYSREIKINHHGQPQVIHLSDVFIIEPTAIAKGLYIFWSPHWHMGGVGSKEWHIRHTLSQEQLPTWKSNSDFPDKRKTKPESL